LVDPAEVAVAGVAAPEALYWVLNESTPVAEIESPSRSAVPPVKVTATVLEPAAGFISVKTCRYPVVKPPE
jgi:hypothetical protein